MSNLFKQMRESIDAQTASAIETVAARICDNMRDKLTADGHAGTGDLLNSITYTRETSEDGKVSFVVGMNAYGRFIDQGTGAAHGGVREGYWRYKDRDGNWHTTNGMDADPFIDISTQDAMDGLSGILAERIEDAIKNLGKE